MASMASEPLRGTFARAAKAFQFKWGYGATAARLTPDQKVGSSNLSGLIFLFAHRSTLAAER